LGKLAGIRKALAQWNTERSGLGEGAQFKGKSVQDLTPDEIAEFGRMHGVENLGPITKIQEVKGNGFDLAVPGGLEGDFTYSDLIWLKANPIDPSTITDGAIRVALQNKLARAATPGPGSDVDLFNRYMFGMLSPNQPLTPNEFELARLRAHSDDEIDHFASFIDWEPGEKVEPARRKAANDKMAEFFGTQARGKGGLGLKGSADYTNLAEFAKMFRQNPDWWRKSPDEDWFDFVERVQSQGRGLSSKVASFSTVWQDPMTAAISAIDRHMARDFLPALFPTKKARKDFERGVVGRYNDMLRQSKEAAPEQLKALRAKGFPPPEAKPVRSFTEVFKQPGGDAVFMQRVMSQLSAKEAKLKLASGEVNPNIPEQLQNVDWLREPEKVQIVGDAYRRALAENERLAAENGLHLFNQQWMRWDDIRRRLEPHEVMFPGLEKLPPMNREQLARSREAHAGAGFMNSSKEMVPDASGELVPRMKPTRPMNFGDAFYYAAPAAAVGLAAMAPSDAEAGTNKMATAPVALAVNDFVQRRAEQGSSIALDALEAAATIGSSVAGDFLSNASQLGGYLNPFTDAAEVRAAGERLAERVQYMPSPDNQVLKPVAEWLRGASDAIESYMPDQQSIDQSIPGQMYNALPEKGQGIVRSAANLFL